MMPKNYIGLDKIVIKRERGGQRKSPPKKLEQKDFLTNLCREFSDKINLIKENNLATVYTFTFENLGTATYVELKNPKQYSGYLGIYGKEKEKHSEIKRQISRKISCDLQPLEEFLSSQLDEN